MPTRFIADPHEMRSMAGMFDFPARRWGGGPQDGASSQNIAGAGWSGPRR